MTPQLGYYGYGIAEAAVWSSRGDVARSGAELAAAVEAGWRGPWGGRDRDPLFAALRESQVYGDLRPGDPD